MAHTARVKLYHNSKAIVLHPLIWLGILLEFLTPLIGHYAAGWIYTITLIVVLLAATIDLNRNKSFFLLVSIFGIGMMGLWLGSNGVPILAQFYEFFHSLEMSYSVVAGSVVAVILLPVLLTSVIMSRIDHEVTVTYNEVTYKSLGLETRSWPRSDITLRARYPDMFEFLLCLSGSIDIYREGTLVATIDHVPLLPWKMTELDRILERTVVEIANHPQAPPPQPAPPS